MNEHEIYEAFSHSGVKRRSGRYPWGSGDDPELKSGDFLSRVEKLKKSELPTVANELVIRILPSLCNLINELLLSSVIKDVFTIPFVPKSVSIVPLTLKRVKKTFPFNENSFKPQYIIFPSGWIMVEPSLSPSSVKG